MRICAVALALFGCSSEAPAAKDEPADAAIADAASSESSDGDATDEGSPPAFEGPLALSETGLYADIATQELAPGVVPYDVRYSLWSDGSTKQRWLRLPPGQAIDTSSMDVWQFPAGTKAWKEFRFGGNLVETRMVEKIDSAAGADSWLVIAYVWNEDGSDAYAAPAGVVDVAGTSHDVPSIEQCQQCHAGVGDVLIGVSAIQLSQEAGGGGFLTTLASEGKLSDPPPAELPVPGDGVVEDALGYLHANCGHCHNDQSFLADKIGLRLKLLSGMSLPEDTPAYQTAINTTAKHLGLGGTSIVVVPGKPQESQLYYRIMVRDLDQMPPLGTEIVDAAGSSTISAWIGSLTP